LKVVADTNILVSALVFPGGPPESVYRHALTGDIALVSSPPLLAELGRVLTVRFAWEALRVESAVGQLIRLSELVDPRIRIEDIKTDPDDNRVLEAALASSADWIVSGDRHLTALGAWRGIPIVTPVRLLADTELHGCD